MPTVAIIGGGLTGLTAAHELTKAGREVRLFEAAARTGGAVVSHAGDGWLVEGGPNTLLETPDVVSVVNDLGLAAERLEASPAAKNRFLLRGGRLIAAPMAPPKILTTPLLSLGAKLRLFAEPFRRPRRRSGDVSLAEFIRDHFGQEVVDYVMNPFVAGIYAGDVAKLSTRHAFAKIWAIEQTHGSIIRGQIAAMKQRRARGEPAAPRSVSFVRGLQTLTDTLAARLPAGTVRTGAAVESLPAVLGGSSGGRRERRTQRRPRPWCSRCRQPPWRVWRLARSANVLSPPSKRSNTRRSHRFSSASAVRR